MSILGDIANTIVSVRNTNKTIQANKQMAEYQYNKDVEMWNRQNDYNKPQAQMERLEEAGLNPNLVYGSGDVTGNTSGPMPKYSAPTQQYSYEAPRDLDVLGKYQDFMQKQANIDQTKELTKNLQQRTINEGIREWILNTQSDSNQLSYQNQKAVADLYRPYKEAQLEGIRLSNRQKGQNLSIGEYQLQMAQERARRTGALLDAQLGNIIANTSNLKSQVSYRDQQKINLKTQNVGQNLKNIGLNTENLYKAPTLKATVKTKELTNEMLGKQIRWMIFDKLRDFIPTPFKGSIKAGPVSVSK